MDFDFETILIIVALGLPLAGIAIGLQWLRRDRKDEAPDDEESHRD